MPRRSAEGEGAGNAPSRTRGGSLMAKDPVCGMNVDEKKTPVSIRYKGKTYYFCSPGCQETFTKSPEKFASEKAGTRHGC